MSADGKSGVGERRVHPRHAVQLDVNYQRGDHYLFSRSSNLSELGIFLVTDAPAPVGTELDLSFRSPGGGEAIRVRGQVMWIDPGTSGGEPGMGIRFVSPDDETRARIKALIRTVAVIE